jgi:hypothetical protein
LWIPDIHGHDSRAHLRCRQAIPFNLLKESGKLFTCFFAVIPNQDEISYHKAQHHQELLKISPIQLEQFIQAKIFSKLSAENFHNCIGTFHQ